MATQQQHSLLRSTSERTPNIVANANNIPKDSLDCGVTALGCCNTHGCQKMGTAKSYLIILCLIGIVQGAMEMYFAVSVRQIALDHSISQTLVDWLLVSSGIFQGLLAVVVAYWGNRIHRISWISGIVMIQAVMTLSTIVPTLFHNTSELNTIAPPSVALTCNEHTSGNLVAEKPYAITTLILLFISQLGISLGHIVFMTLGLSYIDDNLEEDSSPGFIGAALAAKFWGPQIGSGLAIGVNFSPFGWWFGWTIISPILFILGFLLALFPRRLLSSIIKDASNEIIETATNSSQLELNTGKFLADINFGPSFKRMITNKILMVNVIAAVFIQTAIVNFYFHDQNYMQSRFHFPAGDQSLGDWTSRVIYNLLKPPMIALAIVVAGLIIAKASPSPRKLAAWNVITGTIVCMFFILYIFIDCNTGTIAGAYRGKLNKPYCASNCLCSENIPFSPVCPENSVQTYYSPCHAGCSEELNINSFKVYVNCTCGVDTEFRTTGMVATDGGCTYPECQKHWITFQVLTVLGAALLGSGLVGNLLISIRSVLPQDKSLAISIELWLLGLIVYIPGKIGYSVIADSTCQLWSPTYHRCYLHESPAFGDIMNIVTASLIGVGVLFDVIVLFLIGNLQLYGEAPDDAYRPIQMQDMSNTNTIPVHNADQPDSRAAVEPYATSPLISSIQNTQDNYQTRPDSNSTTYATPADNDVTRNNNLNNYVFSELRKNNPDEDIPLDFSMQATDSELSASTIPPRDQQQPQSQMSPRPGPSGILKNNLTASPGAQSNTTDSDSEASGVGYQRLIRPSQMKAMVKRQSAIDAQKKLDSRPTSPETNF